MGGGEGRREGGGRDEERQGRTKVGVKGAGREEAGRREEWRREVGDVGGSRDEGGGREGWRVNKGERGREGRRD